MWPVASWGRVKLQGGENSFQAESRFPCQGKWRQNPEHSWGAEEGPPASPGGWWPDGAAAEPGAWGTWPAEPIGVTASPRTSPAPPRPQGTPAPRLPHGHRAAGAQRALQRMLRSRGRARGDLPPKGQTGTSQPERGHHPASPALSPLPSPGPVGPPFPPPGPAAAKSPPGLQPLPRRAAQSPRPPPCPAAPQQTQKRVQGSLLGHRDTLQQPQPGLTLPAATCPSPGHSAPLPLAATSPLQNVPSLSPGHTSDPHGEQEQGRGQPRLGGQRTQPGRAGRTGKLSPLESQECQERQEATLPHSQEGLRVHREGGEGRAPSLSGGTREQNWAQVQQEGPPPVL